MWTSDHRRRRPRVPSVRIDPLAHLGSLGLATLILLVGPIPASAQYSVQECTNLLREESQAMNERADKRLISLSRQNLTHCKHLMGLDEYTSELVTLAIGLSGDGQHSEALGVANRCLEISSAHLPCIQSKADALLELKRPQEAKAVLERGLSYAAITERDVRYKRLLQKMLVRTNAILQDQPGQPAERKAEGFGSAFFVSGAGHIMTNSHVVRGCGSLATASGTALKFIASDDGTDLALLQAAGTKPPGVATFRHEDAALGESIIVFGFPLAGLLSTAGNVTTGTISATSGIRDNPRNFQITAPVQPGNSGGPLLDQSGNVVGMVVSKLNAMKAANLTGDMPQNVNFAIKGREIVAFLNRAGVAPAFAMGTVHSTTESVAASAASFSLRIICRR